MQFWLREVFFDFIKQKWLIFLFVVVFFCTGIFFGAVAAKALSLDQADNLSVYLNGFLDKVATVPADSQIFLLEGITNNLYLMVAIYVLGLTIIGIPLVLITIFSRGFILGFTVGFLVREKAVKGFIFALLSLLPHNIIIIPTLILAGVTALSFSALMLKRRFSTHNRTIAGSLGAYTGVMLLLCLITTAAGLVEVYITPMIIRTAAVYIR